MVLSGHVRSWVVPEQFIRIAGDVVSAMLGIKVDHKYVIMVYLCMQVD